MTFNELNLIKPILKALKNEGYKVPSPIQTEAIPPLLAGRDLLGCAQTGTGKTAAFAIPILQMLYEQRLKQPAEKNSISKRGLNPSQKRKLQALILTPTRELALQICESFQAYGCYTGIKTLAIFGGTSQIPQVAELRKGVDVLVATPGRLLDLMGQNLCDLSSVSMFVLDEADRMLDMGFIQDVKKIIAKLPKERQTQLFSATMIEDVSSLALSILRNPVTVTVTPVSSTVDMIDQSVYFVDKANKGRLLIELLNDKKIVSALIFSRTKHGADKICRLLTKAGVTAGAIHGNKSQPARQKALTDFKAGKIRVLVATDIAARGIDIDQLSHVINYDLPNVAETYVHRIGRTGRAGLGGVAISFCDFDEQAYLKDIQKLIQKKIPVVENHSYPMQILEHIEPKTKPRLTEEDRNRKLTEKAMDRKEKSAVLRNRQQKSGRNHVQTARNKSRRASGRNAGINAISYDIKKPNN